MKNDLELKEMVKDRYGKIANQEMNVNATSCWGATEASEMSYNIMMDDYTEIQGYSEQANLGLGCGLPTQYAKIATGDTVVDLGSGAGNDCFIARHETGETGKVIGLDFSAAMIAKARKNTVTLGFNNVEFREADIDDMPIGNNEVNVVVSNCVLNLLPKKDTVFKEIFRILKPGGHFSISDVVLVGELPLKLQEDAEMYAGCVAGAIQKADYLMHIENAGFKNIKIQKEKRINNPYDILEKYIDTREMADFESGQTGIYSITVFGEKQGNNKTKAASERPDLRCDPKSGCC